MSKISDVLADFADFKDSLFHAFIFLISVHLTFYEEPILTLIGIFLAAYVLSKYSIGVTVVRESK